MMSVEAMKTTIAAFLAEHELAGAPIVGAGSAMWLYGLRSDTRDIDLYLPGMGEFHVEWVHNGIEVDAHNSWELSEGLSERVVKGATVIAGLRVMGLAELLETYRVLNRPKDQTSIALLEKRLSL
jgi:hypothetical protein